MLKIKILQKCIFSDPNPALQAKFLQKYNIFGRKRAYRLGKGIHSCTIAGILSKPPHSSPKSCTFAAFWA
ncbi:hypothetical protein [Paenibacillus cisolokensis]|uniref:hypothetical protein n=1 Tax=Paenibacillus cisolokensis TaxID=1658519 RepID=UPI001BCDBB24|nr:hypothetical protein [Paenibacillus cisolokensis]